jgi:hypothetical protein
MQINAFNMKSNKFSSFKLKDVKLSISIDCFRSQSYRFIFTKRSVNQFSARRKFASFKSEKNLVTTLNGIVQLVMSNVRSIIVIYLKISLVCQHKFPNKLRL